MLSITLILLIYLYPVVRGFILNWSRSIFTSFLAKDNRNVFVRHGIRRHAKFRPITTLYFRAFATADDHIKDYFLWDTYGIPFVIDNSVTNIIIIQRRIFTGPLIPTSMTLETVEGITTTTKLVGSMKLILTDRDNNN